METCTKTSFREATKLFNIWNKTVEWNGLKLATVLWHFNKEWKVVDTLDHELVKSRTDKTHVIAEFHTQEELWEYIKNNNLNICNT